MSPEVTNELINADLQAAARLRKAVRHFQNQSARILRGHGLTNERYELLLAIDAAQSAQRRATIPELCHELELAQSSLTQLVRRAQDAGLVDREVSRQDARVRYLILTETGAHLLADAAAELGPERERLLELLGSLDQQPA